MADTERRLCLDGSNRQPKFIIPALRDALAAGGRIEGLALVSALWCRYCAGVTDKGTPIAPNDPNWDRLQPLALAARTDPQVGLDQRAIYGDLAANARFQTAFAQALGRLWRDGTAAVLLSLIHS